jgi:hypothetical protein
MDKLIKADKLSKDARSAVKAYTTKFKGEKAKELKKGKRLFMKTAGFFVEEGAKIFEAYGKGKVSPENTIEKLKTLLGMAVAAISLLEG